MRAHRSGTSEADLVSVSIVQGLYPGALFLVFPVFRFAFNIGIFDRPVAMGIAWGALTGDWQTSIGIGVFFELFWLDHFPAGTFIPANSTLATLAALSLSRLLDLHEPTELALPMLMCLPLALLGARMDLLQRRKQDAGYNQLLRWSRRPGASGSPPERIIAASTGQILLVTFIQWAASLAILGMFFHLIDPHRLMDISNRPINWSELWFIAAIGGILSLRRRISYAVLILAVAGSTISRLLF